MNPNDEIREKILKHLYDTYKTAKNTHRAKVTGVMLERAIEKQGYKKEEVVSNFLYLVQTNWIKKETESYTSGGLTIGGKKTPVTRGKTTYYMISDKGINHFEGASAFQKSTWQTGINITNVQGVTVIGDNNFVRNEYSELYRNLELLSDELRGSAAISDEDKINYTSDIDTIKSQLGKPNPAKQIIQQAWSGLSTLSTIEGIMQFYQRVEPLIKPFLS